MARANRPVTGANKESLQIVRSLLTLDAGDVIITFVAGPKSQRRAEAKTKAKPSKKRFCRKVKKP